MFPRWSFFENSTFLFEYWIFIWYHIFNIYRASCFQLGWIAMRFFVKIDLPCLTVKFSLIAPWAIIGVLFYSSLSPPAITALRIWNEQTWGVVQKLHSMHENIQDVVNPAILISEDGIGRQTGYPLDSEFCSSTTLFCLGYTDDVCSIWSELGNVLFIFSTFKCFTFHSDRDFRCDRK